MAISEQAAGGAGKFDENCERCEKEYTADKWGLE